MRPARSIVAFTTLAGLGQGLACTLAGCSFLQLTLPIHFVRAVLGLAVVLLLSGLAASFFHLGHPRRAWRAALMWRTSWMSREVIVLPLFIAGLAWVALSLPADALQAALPWGVSLAIWVASVLLWCCTGMIYAAIRFIPEWAHALTLVNFSLIGLASGSVLFCALAFVSGLPSVGAMAGPWALAFTFLAAASRSVSLWRNARLQPKSSLQSAIGVASPRIVQKSMGMMGGSFNTREFFHGAQPRTVLQIRWAFFVLTFGAPAALMALALGAASGESLSAKISCIWCLAALSQWPGLALERWAFLAETSHPQNLYYQNVG